MLRSCLWPGLILLALPALALADDAAPTPAPTSVSTPSFWREDPLANTTMPSLSATPVPVSRAQFFNAVSGQISFVGALNDWRNTLRGTGSAPRRDLWKNTLAQGQVALSLGNVNAPGLAGFSGTGTAISWVGKSGASFDAGTTARPAQLDELMQHYDKETTDDKNPIPILDRTSVTWIRAKPISTKGGQVEAVLLRAARDGKVGEGEDWTSGDFGSVNARLAMPGKWTLTGGWNESAMDASKAASSWNTAATGPLSHPWGVANVSLNWHDTQAGYGSFAGQNLGGDSGGTAQITQDIKTPLITGQVVANTSTLDRASTNGVTAGTEMGHDAAGANADLKVQVLPNVSLTAKGNVTDTKLDIATTPPTDGAPTVATSHQNLTGAGGDLGVEVKVTKALSIAAGAGLTQATQVIDMGTPLSNLESRATLQVKHQTGGGSWLASLQARDRTSSADSASTDANNARWARIAGVGLQGDRRLFGDLRLSAKLNWMIDRAAENGDPQGVARLASAQLAFAKAANVDLRYRDGAALPTTLTADPLGSLFSSSTFTNGSHEIATRINLGSAANGKGFGMAFEWARQGTNTTPNDTWKVGITYK